MTAFLKMHALGNDFVLIDARTTPVMLDTAQVRALADRRTGIGFDQLLLVGTSETATASLRFWNADGSEVAACGNGSRAVAAWLGGRAVLETAAGLITTIADGDHAEIDMGKPQFGWEQVPLAYALDTLHLPLAWEMLHDPAALSVGNPHLVFMVDDPDAVPLDRLGPLIETDPVFPEGVNVGVVAVLAPGHVRLRVWERGAGLTRACGTGAVAAVAALQAKRKVADMVTVSMPGGDVGVRRDEAGHLYLSGPATVSFAGNIDLSAFG